MSQKLSSPFVKIFVLGGAVGFAAGIASAKKIKEMMPKIIALAANEYVKGRLSNVKDKVFQGFHALGSGTKKVTHNLTDKARQAGHKVAEGTHGLKEKVVSVRDLVGHDEQRDAG